MEGFGGLPVFSVVGVVVIFAPEDFRWAVPCFGGAMALKELLTAYDTNVLRHCYLLLLNSPEADPGDNRGRRGSVVQVELFLIFGFATGRYSVAVATILFA